jgi:hypothetical protein
VAEQVNQGEGEDGALLNKGQGIDDRSAGLYCADLASVFFHGIK